MGLLNDVKNEVKAEAEVAAGTSDKKAKAKERKEAKKAALANILAYLKDHPVDSLKQDVALLTTVRTSPILANSGLTPEKLFGKVEVGAKVASLEVFTKHRKGYPEMRKYMKKWAEKGVEVVLDEASLSYVIKSVK